MVDRALGVQEEDTLILCPSILSREPCNDILLENISSAPSPPCFWRPIWMGAYMAGLLYAWLMGG